MIPTAQGKLSNGGKDARIGPARRGSIAWPNAPARRAGTRNTGRGFESHPLRLILPEHCCCAGFMARPSWLS